MNNTSNTVEKPKFKKYYPAPPIIESVYEYQDVNKDVNLRKQVTLYYYNKLLKWIETDDMFKHISKKNLESVDGQYLIYKLLRKFIKKSKVNWYDLRDNHSLIKEYLYKILKK
jgi:hypothetical protein